MNARIAVLLTLVATSVALAQEKADLPRDIFGGLITARNDMDKWHTGKVKALTDSTVTVEGMNFKPDALKGKVINPNFDRPITSEGLYSGFYYRIVGNTADTITVDTSGGKLTDHAQAGDTYLMAGFFHIEKAGNRYVMIDPLGHPFIPMGPCAFGVDLSRYMTADLLKLKYGTSQKWLEASVARLKGLGWTATMEFGGITWAGRYGQNRHPCLPYIRIVRVAEEGMRQKTSEPRGVWDSPIKNLLEGIHIRIFMDVFDPQFAKSYGKGEYRPMEYLVEKEH